MTTEIALSYEKMKHLESLGVDTSDASMCYLRWNHEPVEKAVLQIESPSEIAERLGNRLDTVSNESGFWSYEVTPAYTLEDLFRKLPQYIQYHPLYYNPHNESIYATDNYVREIKDERIQYTGKPSNGVIFACPYNDSILNAFYEALLWTIQLTHKEEATPSIDFEPFDKVLVRNSESQTWRCALFSHADTFEGQTTYYANCQPWSECIPFEGNEELIGK